MLSKQEWNANKDSTSIIYCFADGTTREITMQEYLRIHPEHSAEDFRIIKQLEHLLRQEQRCFAFRVAARLLHSGKLTAVQRRCFIAYFIEGKTVAEIARAEKTYRMTIWRHIRRLEAALRDAV